MHNLSKVGRNYCRVIIFLTIAYRNLLPTDNFSDSEFFVSIMLDWSGLFCGPGYLTCESQGESHSMSVVPRGSKSTTSGVRMMTVNRGFTEEADSLLDYLVRSSFFFFGMVELM